MELVVTLEFIKKSLFEGCTGLLILPEKKERTKITSRKRKKGVTRHNSPVDLKFEGKRTPSDVNLT